jgi:hypothetical protein
MDCSICSAVEDKLVLIYIDKSQNLQDRLEGHVRRR